MKEFVFVGIVLLAFSLSHAQAPAPATPPDSTNLIIVSSPPAFYPKNVDPKTINGDVLVKLHVNEKGEVESAEFLSGDPALKDEAISTGMKWKFKPFIRNGAPIPVVTRVNIKFTTFPMRVRVSQTVSEGLIKKKVPPEYPPIARDARIQGSVVMQAVIATDGSLKDLRVISGHPMLAPAAIEAVKQWKYKPYTLNGEPVEVDTQITVNFQLRR